MTPDTNGLDRTHDPAARSWVWAANAAGADFPLQSLPFGAFVSAASSANVASLGVAIGDQVLDLRAAAQGGLLDGLGDGLRDACCASVLNDVLALGRPAWHALRDRLHGLLRDGDGLGDPLRSRTASCLEPLAQIETRLPVEIGDYTDFYASVHHATNVGTMLRPEAPLLPNYKWVPVGYHGRASTVVVTGTPITRPAGQTFRDGEARPRVGPSQRLDYELEVAAIVGPGNVMGRPIPLDEADDHLFGLCLLNDWSARDVQAWEYQPLGPFLAKNFATSLSAWVVTLDAMAPYRVPRALRPDGDPAPLPYLDSASDRTRGALSLVVEAWLSTALMRSQGIAPVRLSRGGFAGMYWTLGQLLTHHASGGCRLRPGDLIASGTVSGPSKDARGCLLELTWRGSEPLTMPTGEIRRFLEDGDEVTLRGRAEAAGQPGLAMGECRGVIVEAADSPRIVGPHLTKTRATERL